VRYILLITILLLSHPIMASADPPDGYVLCHTPDHDGCIWDQDSCGKVRIKRPWLEHLQLILERNDVAVSNIVYDNGKVVIYYRYTSRGHAR
jgi:hypothetical protein